MKWKKNSMIQQLIDENIQTKEQQKITFEQSVINNIEIGNEKMILTGRAVTFDQINDNGVQHFKSSYEKFDFTKPVSALLEHNKNIKIGKTFLHLKDDGIDFEMHLNKNKQAGLDAWEDVKFGTTSAVSIGFNATVSYKYDDNWNMLSIDVEEASIYEVSLVDNPADTTADVTEIQTKKQTKGDFKQMKNKDIFDQLRGKEHSVKSPEDIENLKQSLQADLDQSRNEVTKLSEQQQDKSYTDKLTPQAFAELNQDLDTASKRALKIEKQIEEIGLIQTQIEQERDDMINQMLIDGKQSKLKSTKVMSAKAKAEFKQGLETFKNYKPVKQNFIQTNANDTLALSIPVVIASDIITQAKRMNDNMWSRVKMGAQSTGDYIDYIITTGTLTKTRGTYIDNVQPSESTMKTEKIKVELGTVTTYITLDQMQLLGTPDEVLQEFINLCLEHLRFGVDSDIYNYDGYDATSKEYKGIQGIASAQAFELGLTLESSYATVPKLNQYLKNEAKKIGVFNYVWTSLDQFTEWAYETDANNIKMYEVKEIDGLPAIDNVKFIVSDFIPSIADSTDKTTPFAIAMVDPKDYVLTPPAGAEMFSVVDRPSPTNWRERERAFFVDAAGQLTKKGRVTAAYKPITGGGE